MPPQPEEARWDENAQPSEFGLIRAKLADIAARTFAAESMVYRTAGLLDRAIARLDHADPLYDRKTIDMVEEFAIECSMIKVFGSEVLSFAADEGLQALGGYGFCEDYMLERIYRDERINRMLIPGVLLRKALKNELACFPAAKLVAAMKKVLLATLGFAAQKAGAGLKDRQEVLSDAADITMEIYACESGLLRALKKAKRDGTDAAAPMGDMVTLYTHDAMDRVAVWGRNILASVASGDELRTTLAGLRRLAKHDPVDRARLPDVIAARIVDADGYAC